MTPDSVMTTLNYTVDNNIPHNHFFYEPSGDDKHISNPAGTDSQQVEVFNGWGDVKNFHVDKEGFELRPFSDSFVEFDNDTLVTTVFYQQVIDFIKSCTGAKRVEVFDHTIRRRMRDPGNLAVQTTTQRPAVQMVHCDYTADSGPQRVRDLMHGEADALLGRRVAFFNLWKPLYETVEELPLAMCDVQSCKPDDLLRTHLLYEDRQGEVYTMRYQPNHRWIYFPNMTTTQALILKTYDSETDGRARFMAHSAFEDPNTPSNPKPRESIEVRTMAFF